jgi:aconitate hydratase
VVPVLEIAGEPLFQAYIGSSGNPGYRDFAVVAEMVRGRTIAEGVSLDVNPSSRQVLTALIREGHLEHLVSCGARLHQAGCNGCIGMGQAPAVGRNSLRTVPRNFPGRSGTREDRVFLCSPETAAASALKGVITDPRTLDMTFPRLKEPEQMIVNRDLFIPPLPIAEARLKPLQKTDNTPTLPQLSPLDSTVDLPVILVTGDNISTDDIMPAGQRVMPYWSSIYASAPFTFEAIDPDYVSRAEQSRPLGGHAIVGGHNYGQGSSRENAALVPRYLGLQVVVAKSFARLHWQNLVCFGALPLTFLNEEDLNRLKQDDRLVIRDVHLQLAAGSELVVEVIGKGEIGKGELRLCHGLSERQRELLIKGGVINQIRSRKTPVSM